MDYRQLGSTGVSVSPLCLGAMMFGAWGNPDHDESIRVIHHALDAGVNFVDTADVYARGESEEIVGKALKGRRDSVVLATKVHGTMHDSDPNMRGNSRRWIVQEVEASLRRLQTDWIDLYQIHRWDPSTGHEETLGALTDLQRAGKIRYLGSSTYPPSAIVEAQWTAERRGLSRFVCEQPPYSMLVRGIEAEVLPTCERYGMGVIPWSPLAGGWLSGQVPQGRRRDEPPCNDGSRSATTCRSPENQQKLDAVEQLAQLAERRGDQPDPPRTRLRAPAPVGVRRDHRPAHPRAARRPARRNRRPALGRGARRDRPDRPARQEPQPAPTPAGVRRTSTIRPPAAAERSPAGS